MTKLKGLSESISPTSELEREEKPSRYINPRLKKFIEEETKMVEGRFRNYENPKGNLRVQIRKYPTIPPFDMTMEDGQTYRVPLYVARHLNGIDATAEAINGKLGTCSYPVHGFKWDPNKSPPSSGVGSGPNGESGVPVPLIGVADRVRRYGFESLEFNVG